VENLNQQITAYTSLIADKQGELDDAQVRLDELNKKNKERIRAMEENGNLSYWSVLFKANSFSDLLDRMSMVQEIAAADRRRFAEMSQAAEEVAEAKEALEEERIGLEENKKQLEASQIELEAKREEADRLLAELVATGDEYEKLIEQAEAEAKDLASDIADKKEDYDAAVKQEQESSSSSSKPTVKDDYVASNATWLVPCKYTKFTSPFGWRVHPVYKEWRFHYGVDLAGPKGTPIKATRSGKVALATYNKSAGYYVKVDHGDGFASLYMHLTHYIVEKGDTVEAGDVIGYMGSTGTSTGSHLHFGITYKGDYVNPAKYIKI
jgi:murein DD-endopeptidase MepM/ murein hydrolase activator NlpD